MRKFVQRHLAPHHLPNPIKMSLIMGPMILLYFTGIGLGYLALIGCK